MAPTYRMTMTKYQITQHLFAPMGTATLLLPDGKLGYIRSIEREDGSGRSFNLAVGLQQNRTAVGVYVRTTD